MRTDLFALVTAAYLLKATAVLLLTILAAMLLRRAPAGTRHLLWLSAVVLVLAVPLLAAVLPRWPVLPVGDLLRSAAPGSVSHEPAVSDASGVGIVELRGPTSGQELILTPSSIASEGGADWGLSAMESAASRNASPGFDPLSALIGLWAVGTLLILGRLGTSVLHLRRTLREADPLTSADWTSPLWEAADRLDLGDAPRLLRSERITMPFACGLLRPTIVVPASADEWSPSRRRAVLFHELAHIRRKDLVGHTLGRLACAVYWIHPLVWSAARRLRAESERACDDLVLSTGTPASEYADHLLQILVGVRDNDAPAVALPMGRRREFEGRMLAILDPALRRHGPTLAHGAVVGALALGALLTTAAAPEGRAATNAQLTLEPHAPLTMSIPGDDGRPAREMPEMKRYPATGDAPPPEPAPSPDPQPAARPTEAGEDLVEVFAMRLATTVESFVTDAASRVFGGVGDAQKNIPLLIRLLATDESPQVRRTAAWGLAEPDRPEAVAALVRALGADTDAEVREMAAWALHESSAPEVPAALRRALRDGSSQVRGRAAWSLAQLEVRDPEVAGEIAAVLGDASPDARTMAAWAIGTLRPAATPAALYDTGLRDEDADVRLASAWALGELADPTTRPYLVAALEREADSDALRALSRALLLLGPLDEGALETILESEDPEIREEAVRIVARGKGALPPWPWPWPEPRPYP